VVNWWELASFMSKSEPGYHSIMQSRRWLCFNCRAVQVQATIRGCLMSGCLKRIPRTNICSSTNRSDEGSPKPTNLLMQSHEDSCIPEQVRESNTAVIQLLSPKECMLTVSPSRSAKRSVPRQKIHRYHHTCAYFTNILTLETA
jgi:hypothetical protein